MNALPQRARSPRILVIGYGNPGRQDDGLGPAAATAIAELGWPEVTTSDNYQLVIEDAVEIAAHDVVWFVDAACDGEEGCTVHRITPSLDFSFTSHLLKPATLLAITAQQFASTPAAYLLAIRGYEFAFAEGLSAQATRNLARAVALLRQRIGEVLQVGR